MSETLKHPSFLLLFEICCENIMIPLLEIITELLALEHPVGPLHWSPHSILPSPVAEERIPVTSILQKKVAKSLTRGPSCNRRPGFWELDAALLLCHLFGVLPVRMFVLDRWEIVCEGHKQNWDLLPLSLTGTVGTTDSPARPTPVLSSLPINCLRVKCGADPPLS